MDHYQGRIDRDGQTSGSCRRGQTFTLSQIFLFPDAMGKIVNTVYFAWASF